MKTFTVIAKILTALAAIAGIVYLAATYGDKIVAWCKKLLASCPCCNGECECEECTCEACDIAEEAPVEEAPAEEIPAEEVVEVVVEDGEPVAEENDFEA